MADRAEASKRPTTKQVTVHPIVLLSAVDHYNRVAGGTKKRVVGMLLGEESKDGVHALSSYALPFEEDDRDPNIWFLDHEYHETMYAMCRKVNVRTKKCRKTCGNCHSGYSNISPPSISPPPPPPFIVGR